MRHGDQILNPRTMEHFVYKVLDDDSAILIGLNNDFRFYVRDATKFELELLYRPQSGICVIEDVPTNSQN